MFQSNFKVVSKSFATYGPVTNLFRGFPELLRRLAFLPSQRGHCMDPGAAGGWIMLAMTDRL